MKARRSLFGSILVISLVIAACSKREEPQIVARIGDLEITASEFRQRFEFTPRLRQFQNVDQAKSLFLGSLIAEKLLAAEAFKEGLAESAREQAFLEQIRREATIAEFYNREVVPKVQITEQELRQAYEKLRKELEIQYVSFKNFADAREFRRRVAAGEAFEQALINFIDKEGNGAIGIDTLKLKWGNPSATLDDKLYDLAPGEVSEPIAALNEFYVARVVSQKVDALGSDDDFSRQRANLENILRKRQATAEFASDFKQIMVGKKTKVPPQRLKYLTERMEEIFHIGADSTMQVRKRNPSPLSEIEFRQAQYGLERNLDETLVTFDDGAQWTIREVLQRLSVGMYHLNFSTSKQFRLSLRQAVITMIEQEYVYKTAVQKGLHKSPSVEDEVEMWRESVAARAFVKKILLADNSSQHDQEAENLTDTQMADLADKLFALANVYKPEIDLKTFRELQVSNAGLLVLKQLFPGRLAVPLGLPLENLTAWQEKVAEKMGHLATNR